MPNKIVSNYIFKKHTTQSKYQTKSWRNSQIWYKDGKHNECELYQREKIEKITKQKCPKTNERINMDKNDIISETRPMKRDDAFDWTEDFDGKQIYNTSSLYYNLKMVVGTGGAQTRSLREVAHFIRSQLNYNKSHIHNPKYFVNILDGDESCKLIDKYKNIVNKPEYKHVKNFVYIGDTYGFIDWFHSLNIQ